MNRFITFFLCIVTIFLLSNCSQQYGVANFGSSVNYVPKQVYRGEKVQDTHLTASGATSLGGAYAEVDKLAFGELSLSRNYTRKNYNLMFGGSGFVGNYQTNYISELSGNKSFFGLSAFGEANLNLNVSEHFTLRPIGLRLSVMYEDGSFADFRREASRYMTTPQQDPVDNIHPQLMSVSALAITELLFLGKKSTFGMRWGLGRMSGGATILNYGMSYNRNRWTISLQSSASLFYAGALTRLGLSYRLK